jgi:hypothetical protein
MTPEKPVYAFFHATFQEYFAAQFIDSWDFFLPRRSHGLKVDSTSQESEGIYRVFEPQWKEVILLWFGRKEIQNRAKNTFVDTLLNFEDRCRGFYEHRAFFMGALAAQEYSDYPDIESVIKNIIEWAFGSLDASTGRWLSYFEPIESEARFTLLNSSSRSVINLLSGFLNKVHNNYRLYEAASLLSQIDFKNKVAIATLFKVLKSSAENDWLQLKIATTLLDIHGDVSEAERSLIQLSRYSEHEWIKRDAALSLLKTYPEHPDAIGTLINLLCTSQEEKILWSLKLDEVKPYPPSLIRALVKMSYLGRHQNTRSISLSYLSALLISDEASIDKFLRLIRMPGSILNLFEKSEDPKEDDIDYFDHLVSLTNKLVSSTEKKKRRKAFWELLKFAVRYPNIALSAARLGSLKKGGEFRKKLIVDLFEKTGNNINLIVPIWIDLIKKMEVRRFRIFLAIKMADAGFEDEEIISTLVKLLREVGAQDEHARRWLAEGIRKYDPCNLESRATLIDLLKNSEDWNTCRWVGSALGEACNDNHLLVRDLIDILLSTEKERVMAGITGGIKEVFDLEELKLVVAGLKEHLNQETRERSSFLYQSIFEIIGHCASRLPYLDFYELWNNQPVNSTSS